GRVGGGDVSVHLGRGRDAADQVEREPADQGGVVGLGGGRYTGGRDRGVDQPVDDRLDRRGVGPGGGGRGQDGRGKQQTERHRRRLPSGRVVGRRARAAGWGRAGQTSSSIS